MKSKKQIREDFRNAVFKRDGYTCKLCGDKESKLDAHHIHNRGNFLNGGYVKSNGITLCDKENGCHLKVEDYYMSGIIWAGDDSMEENNPLHPERLYKLIGSSWEEAKKDDLRLK